MLLEFILVEITRIWLTATPNEDGFPTNFIIVKKNVFILNDQCGAWFDILTKLEILAHRDLPNYKFL